MITPIVLSVPHTGSRSLLAHLGVKDWGGHQYSGGLLHFGYEDDKIKSLGKIEVHIPVRHPIETLESWCSRNLPLKRCIERNMARLVDYNNPKAVYYDVHTLDGPKVGVLDKPRYTDATIRAMDAWDAYATPRIKAFYEEYYGKI